ADAETLDPGKTNGAQDGYIVIAMFEGLTSCHPQTLEPMAALATHYEMNADHTQFPFYLPAPPPPRGPPNPRGTRLPNTDTLREQYQAGKQGIPLILQQQWRKELNIDVTLVNQEFKVWIQSVIEVNYNGVAETGAWPDYVDPNP